MLLFSSVITTYFMPFSFYPIFRIYYTNTCIPRMNGCTIDYLALECHQGCLMHLRDKASCTVVFTNFNQDDQQDDAVRPNNIAWGVVYSDNRFVYVQQGKNRVPACERHIEIWQKGLPC